MQQPLSSLNVPLSVLHVLKSLGYKNCVDWIKSVKKYKEKYTDIAKLLQTPITKSALDVYQEECFLGSIPTLITSFDAALDGGIPIGLITEIAGDVDTKKTELCYRFCTNVQLPKWCGGIEGKAVFIGTNKNFSPQRLNEIAENCYVKYCALKKKLSVTHNEFTIKSILENINYINVMGVFELIAAVKYLERWFKSNKNIRLVIIDSISTPFKQTSLHDRKHLHIILTSLLKMAQQYDFAVVLTNEMSTKFNSVGRYLTPALGDKYYHRINIRIELKRINKLAVQGCVKKCNFNKTNSFDLVL